MVWNTSREHGDIAPERWNSDSEPRNTKRELGKCEREWRKVEQEQEKLERERGNGRRDLGNVSVEQGGVDREFRKRPGEYVRYRERAPERQPRGGGNRSRGPEWPREERELQA